MIEKYIYQIAFVINSKYRKIILNQLKNNPQTPTILAKKNKWCLSSTSRSLLELEYKNLVKVLNPQNKQNRIYKITKLGLKILLLSERINLA